MNDNKEPNPGFTNTDPNFVSTRGMPVEPEPETKAERPVKNKAVKPAKNKAVEPSEDK